MALDPQFAETIIEVNANFGFFNFDCDPEDITSVLGIMPDTKSRRGDDRILRTGKKFHVLFSTWNITSKSDSKDVNVHCREILLRLGNVSNLFDPKWGVPSFGILYKASHLGNGPFYEVDVVQGIASLGAELWQDIYSIDEDETDHS